MPTTLLSRIPTPADTDENESVSIAVLDNDQDVDLNDLLSLDSASIAATTGLSGSPDAAGTVSIQDSQLVFTPGTAFDELDAGDTATVLIGYTISDARGAQSSSSVAITVQGSNDAPSGGSDSATTSEDSSVTVNVLANDQDVDGSDGPDNFTLDSASITATSGLEQSPARSWKFVDREQPTGLRSVQ